MTFLSPEDARALVAPFYDALTTPSRKAVAALITSNTDVDWESHAGEGSPAKQRDAFIEQVQGFGKFIPDLAWSIREVISAEDRIALRSQATGTPAGDFMGVPHGGLSFNIMTIDLHTVRNGKLASVYHIEDWATALQQLAHA